MIKHTKDYDIFKLRPDNRKIDPIHVKKLGESIFARNMLDLEPILVNQKMEIIDGQHRLMAAKQLGIEIYYKIDNNMNPEDIIRLNIAKNWGQSDYLNFYCQQGYTHYLKLKEFMDKNQLGLRLALNICIGKEQIPHKEFREGKFQFEKDFESAELDCVKETIRLIKKSNGFSPYTDSIKFWGAMLKMIRQPNFEMAKWYANLPKMSDQFSIKATEKGYISVLARVYNYRNDFKINFTGEEE